MTTCIELAGAPDGCAEGYYRTTHATSFGTVVEAKHASLDAAERWRANRMDPSIRIDFVEPEELRWDLAINRASDGGRVVNWAR